MAAGLSNEDVIAAAVPAFAARLGVLAPAQVRAQVGTGAVRMLDLHAAALVAVLRSAPADGPITVRVSDVVDELLGHEARFWQGSAARLGLTDGAGGLDARELRRVVAAGALLGAASRDQAVQLLARAGVAESARMAEWLRELYPPDDGPDGNWLGTLARAGWLSAWSSPSYAVTRSWPAGA